MSKEFVLMSLRHACDLPTNKKASEVYDAVTGSILEALEAGESVPLRGFGTFSVRERKARNGVNPRTGKAMKIAASKVVHFKPGGELTERVRKGERGSDVADRVQRQLNEVKDMAEDLGKRAKSFYKSNLESKVNDLYDLGKKKVDAYSEGGSGAFTELKVGFRKALHEIRESFKKAKGKL